MTELLHATTPVFEVDQAVVGALARDVLHLEVEETVAGLKTLCARFVAVGPSGDRPQEEVQYLDGAVFDFGRSLALSIGAPGQARVVFEGRITGLEACFEETREPQVVIYAEDRLMDLRMVRRVRTYRDVTDADIARALANEHGLDAEVDTDGPSYDVVQQWNTSDLAFLRERAQAIQAEVWIQGTTLFFQQRPRRAGTELTLVQGNDLIAVSVCADLAHQRTAVTVSGFDAGQREAINEQADGATIDVEVTAGRTGPSILARALGERESHRMFDVPLASGEAAAWARAEMVRRSRGFVQARGTTSGSPDMVVGSRLHFDGVGRPFEGTGYYVTRACHSYDLTSGYRTHFEAERPIVEENA